MSDLLAYIERQINWSSKTFGDSARAEGICKHIESELEEIRDNPGDLMEWADVIILGIDGVWRSGHSAQEIWTALQRKQAINAGRTYPRGNDDEPSFHKK